MVRRASGTGWLGASTSGTGRTEAGTVAAERLGVVDGAGGEVWEMRGETRGVVVGSVVTTAGSREGGEWEAGWGLSRVWWKSRDHWVAATGCGAVGRLGDTSWDSGGSGGCGDEGCAHESVDADHFEVWLVWFGDWNEILSLNERVSRSNERVLFGRDGRRLASVKECLPDQRGVKERGDVLKESEGSLGLELLEGNTESCRVRRKEELMNAQRTPYIGQHPTRWAMMKKELRCRAHKQ